MKFVPLFSHKKIYIVGPSGSGKTTLGKTLCRKYNIPHFELDHIAYPNGEERSHQERVKEVEKLAKKDSWVTEGIYVNFTKPLFEATDSIIWLDLPYFTTLLRVIKRFIVHKIRGDEKYGFINTLKFIINLRKYFYPKKGEEYGTEDKQTTRLLTKKTLQPYKEKVIHIKSDSDLKKFLIDI